MLMHRHQTLTAINNLQKVNKQSVFESLKSLAWPLQLLTQWKVSDFKLPKWFLLRKVRNIHCGGGVCVCVRALIISIAQSRHYAIKGLSVTQFES